jgi:hypothetical protein
MGIDARVVALVVVVPTIACLNSSPPQTHSDSSVDAGDAPDSTSVEAPDASRTARWCSEARDGGSTACVPLSDPCGGCPATWAAAIEDNTQFCAAHADGLFSAFVSTEACRGRLRYTQHVFDGGPRYCQYDPISERLTGFAHFDGKALYEAWSCDTPKEDFDDRDCPGLTCEQRDGS